MQPIHRPAPQTPQASNGSDELRRFVEEFAQLVEATGRDELRAAVQMARQLAENGPRYPDSDETHIWRHIDFKERWEAAERILAAIRELHSREHAGRWHGGKCAYCHDLYPCPTVRILDDSDGA